MNEYRVKFALPTYVKVFVNASSEEEAVSIALTHIYLKKYSDKLIGVEQENVFIEAGEIPLEGEDFEITAERIK